MSLLLLFALLLMNMYNNIFEVMLRVGVFAKCQNLSLCSEFYVNEYRTVIAIQLQRAWLSDECLWPCESKQSIMG